MRFAEASNGELYFRTKSDDIIRLIVGFQ